jgi:hypothetical protein
MTIVIETHNCMIFLFFPLFLNGGGLAFSHCRINYNSCILSENIKFIGTHCETGQKNSSNARLLISRSVSKINTNKLYIVYCTFLAINLINHTVGFTVDSVYNVIFDFVLSLICSINFIVCHYMFTECDFFYYKVFKSNSWRGVLDTTLCNIFAVGRWFSQGTPVSSTTKKK